VLSGLTDSFAGLAGVFFVDAAARGRWERLASIPAAERWLADLGLPDRMPFVLRDDGSPARVANRWLTSLPAHRVPELEQMEGVRAELGRVGWVPQRPEVRSVDGNGR
jgi:hypothetical protein